MITLLSPPVTVAIHSRNRNPTPINLLLTPDPSRQNDGVSRTVAFTTPQNYADRLTHLLTLKKWAPLWCPTVVVEATPLTQSNVLLYLKPPNPFDIRRSSLLEDFSAIAFTSRTGISVFTAALVEIEAPPLSPFGEIFTISALGSDSDLLTDDFIARICANSERIRVLVPPNATPSGLVESLGPGLGRKVLCPVPLVVGLEEPQVIPDFLRDLDLMGWDAVRVDGYETRWAGPNSAERLVTRERETVDAIVFTSTAEVEGLLKGLGEIGLGWGDLRRRWPGLVVAAHGPVTALGAERLGLRVDVVSSRFSSFDGVVEALAHTWQSSSSYM
ncbi:hypothetical protein Nepgr_008470 [Nepenthes gracilis]|uniref:Tetrapyrrole biosynthesis uroporphyrinogen III synthase domain-containing protein n=1 Tax=Nepenthes gracilis TaxID=150966 RepID=A0AAD3XJE7_NEPGR|nr:hypothetical protein Nepgr_008470 [Nepenthes gracilis]